MQIIVPFFFLLLNTLYADFCFSALFKSLVKIRLPTAVAFKVDINERLRQRLEAQAWLQNPTGQPFHRAYHRCERERPE